MCFGLDKTTSDTEKNCCRNSKKQLPKEQKTAAEKAKNNRHKIKNLLLNMQKTVAERAKSNCLRSAQNNCRTRTKLLLRQEKTTTEAAIGRRPTGIPYLVIMLTIEILCSFSTCRRLLLVIIIKNNLSLILKKQIKITL